MKLLIIPLLVITFASCVQAQESDSTVTTEESEYSDTEFTPLSPDKLPTTVEYKIQKLQLKKFNPESWKRIVGTTDFEEKPIQEKSPKEPLIKLAPWSNGILKLIAYILILGIIAFIIYFVMKNVSVSSIRAKDVATAPGDFPKGEDNIEAFDMEAQLQLANATENLRLVVRIYFLGLLKRLHEKELIAWKKDKTNLEYLMELFYQNNFYEEVRKLTLAYEIVWYGERAITREPLEKLIHEFETIHQQINNYISK